MYMPVASRAELVCVAHVEKARFSMKTTILVFGASGFIGSNLMRGLDRKLYEVVGVDLARNSRLGTEVEICDDEAGVWAFITKLKFDVVINCVGSANVQASFEEPFRDFQT